MKLSVSLLSIAAALLISVNAAPQSLELIDRSLRVACPEDSYTAGSQTYSTDCSHKLGDGQKTPILTAPARNFVACLQLCSGSSDTGTCCRLAEFDRRGNQCNLYSTNDGFFPFAKGWSVGTAISQAASCQDT